MRNRKKQHLQSQKLRMYTVESQKWKYHIVMKKQIKSRKIQISQ